VARAYRRGVDVKVVFEYEQISQYSEYEGLRSQSVHVRVDTHSGLMHDKVAVIDGKYVLTGSFNWSAAAQNDNNENLIILKSQSLATAYETEFQRIWSSSAS
jgi:phosphatidylserine/phosphatidylglycerophosphate/cardiolipin synthase-like enzyme